MNISSAPYGHGLPNRLTACTLSSAWTLSSTCTSGRGWEGGGDGCTDPQAPRTFFSNPHPQTWPTLQAKLPTTAAGQDLLSLLAATVTRSRVETGTLQGEKFPPRARPALACPSPPRSPFAPSSCSCTPDSALQPMHSEATPPKKKKNPPRTLDSAGDPRLHQALPPWSFSAGAPAQGERATRPPQSSPRARRDWSREPNRGTRDVAAATGARRRRREAARRKTAAGGGARGREIPICSPDYCAACREEHGLSSRLRAAAATARRLAIPSSPSQPTPTHTAKPLSLVSPLLPLSRCLLLPNRERKGRGGEKPRRPG